MVGSDHTNLTVCKLLLLANPQPSFDASSSFRRKAEGRLRMLVFGAFIHRRMQESHLRTESTTPTTYQQVEPKTESLQE